MIGKIDPLSGHVGLKADVKGEMGNPRIRVIHRLVAKILSKRGTITLPPDMRRKLGLDLANHPMMLVELRDGGIFLQPAEALPMRDIPEETIRDWVLISASYCRAETSKNIGKLGEEAVLKWPVMQFKVDRLQRQAGADFRVGCRMCGVADFGQRRLRDPARDDGLRNAGEHTARLFDKRGTRLKCKGTLEVARPR